MKQYASILLAAIFLLAGPAFAETERETYLREQFADFLITGGNDAYVDELVTKGLDRSDSERIVNEFAHDVAGCIIDALRQYSVDESLDFDEQLNGLEASLMQDAVNAYFRSLDEKDLERRAELCNIEAAQAAGIDLPG